ncbi:MAG: glycosyl transferase family 2 [Actinobacteria bacterium 13_2_20CM_2_71_6]|nr:MAG: glycosyl transferase family 2 [Actinobacteria bacterium 13_2_20CM_2_71_6]
MGGGGRVTTAVEHGVVPGIVRDVGLSAPLPHLAPHDDTGRRAAQAWLLVRLFTEPLGLLTLDLPDEGLPATALADAIEREYGLGIRERIARGGGDPAAPLVGGVRVPGVAPFLARRKEVLSDAPPITVVLCTRDRPDALATCLDSLLAQQYPSFRVLVVDNAPSDESSAQVVRAAAERGPVDYLLAPVPGLSHARNAAVVATPGEILAWIDDDEIADPHWLAEIARALADHPMADVVSGVIVPAELETPAQVWFEQFGGHSKGRGFTRAVFSPATAKTQSPLYPLPPFGTGANMAFRPRVIERIGGFDTALGAGTPAMGSEDTLAFTQVLRSGGTIVYQPTALVRHFHRRDLDGLRRQMVGYGTGLTAAYTALVRRNPLVLFPLVRLVPTALRDVLGGGLRTATIREDFPRELLSANRRGMLRGPRAYFAGRRQDRQRIKSAQP